MAVSNSKNYLKTYIWQGLALFLRFLSMFIVVPFLSAEPKIYGVYAICISALIFLNYADLGFLRASQKYAAECYAQNKRFEEMRFIGFGIFVLLVFVSLISIVFLFFSFYPDKLIEGLDTIQLKHIASSLLLILSIFTPFIAIQRMASIIFDIRMQGYINKRISILASAISILSVFYFFSSEKYLIIEYFLFFQSINFLSTIVMLIIAKRIYKYDIIKLFKNISYNRKVFLKSKSLAFSSFFAMIAWVIFYEIDQIVIGRFISVEKVAFFAISIMFATLFRSIFGIIFAPFGVRANYFVGNNDEQGLDLFIKRVLILTAPITILPTIAISIISKPLILTWVGPDYYESIIMAQLFALVFSMSFITYIASAYMVAKEKINEIYYISILMPFIYWIGIYLSYSYLNLISFPLFKLIVTFLSVIYYLYILHKYIKFSWLYFIKKIIKPISIPILFLVFTLTQIVYVFPLEKSRLNFLVVITITGLVILMSFIIQYLVSEEIRQIVKTIIKDITNQKSIK